MLSVVVLLLSGAGAVSQTSALQTELSEYWQQQYQELNGKINERQGLKKADSDENVIADKNALILSTDRTPSDVLYRRTKALIQNLSKTIDAKQIAEFERKLESLKPSAATGGLAKTNEQSQFLELSALNRAVAISNPLIDFDDLIFVGYAGNVGGTENHMCDQYNPWNVAGGGGLYMLKNIKGTPTLVDILKNSKCVNGSFKGSNLAGGGFLSPDLSYDGKKIVFAWTSMQSKCYHIFKVNIDGTELTQLTDGAESQYNFLQNSNHNDFDPCWLPNGRIAFISDRRGGYGRCHTKSKPTFTLHSMKDDGSDIICLSYHETNEWNPSVDNNGKIVYTRWDYVDRDDCIAHHLWTCFPDGRDPRSYHGNYPLPLQTLNGPGYDGRRDRPCAELHIRAIPNSSKYIATSGPHHGFSWGDLVTIDPTIEDDGKVSQIKKLTTSQSGWPDAPGGAYATAYPLSEDYYICNKISGGNKTIILRDKTGNEQLIYSTGAWHPFEPIPVRAVTKPPVLATKTWDGERKSLSDHYRATIQVSNVYEGDIPLPNGVKVSAMRIVQVFPKETINVSEPRNGYPAEALTRMSLGTVPVEEDGSVYCEAPVDKILYFQLLDENGLAVQSMRSATYVHKGEQMACIGCHENKWKATPVTTNRIAFKRAPSKLTPDAGGVEPVNYARLAKPVFDKNCRSCHVQKNRQPDFSYGSLKNYAFYWCGDGNPWLNGDIITSLRGGSRTTPGKFGASYSKLKKYIDGNHQNVKLTSDEYKRVALWLDLNSNELGADYNVNDQKAGKLVWPRIDLDQSNPQGIETKYPLMGDVAVSKHLYRPVKINRNGTIISFNNPDFAIGKVSMYDLSGRCVFTRNFNSNEAYSFVIDLKNGNVSKGTYVVNVEKNGSDQKIEPIKFVVN